jgi:hypothetical protein
MIGGSAQEKHGLSVLLWTLAILLWGASEAVLLYAKAHKSIHELGSMWTWYLPLMVILPSLTAIDTYFRFARTLSGAEKDKTSQTWSNLLAALLCVTNLTILVCIAILVTGKY